MRKARKILSGPEPPSKTTKGNTHNSICKRMSNTMRLGLLQPVSSSSNSSSSRRSSSSSSTLRVTNIDLRVVEVAVLQRHLLPGKILMCREEEAVEVGIGLGQGPVEAWLLVEAMDEGGEVVGKNTILGVVVVREVGVVEGEKVMGDMDTVRLQ